MQIYGEQLLVVRKTKSEEEATQGPAVRSFRGGSQETSESLPSLSLSASLRLSLSLNSIPSPPSLCLSLCVHLLRLYFGIFSSLPLSLLSFTLVLWFFFFSQALQGLERSRTRAL